MALAGDRATRTHTLRIPRSGPDNEATTHCGMTGAQFKVCAEFITESGRTFHVSGGEPTCRNCRQRLKLDKVGCRGKIRLTPRAEVSHR